MKNEIIKRSIHASGHLNEPIEYKKSFSRGMRVSHNGLTTLFISGTASIDGKGKSCHPKDLLAQIKRTFSNLTALLGSEGATWHDVVKTRCYLKNMKDYDKFNDVRNRFYQKQGLNPFPASVCVQATLCRPELLVEIEATAVLESSRKNKISQWKK